MTTAKEALRIARGYIVDDVKRKPSDYDPSSDLRKIDEALVSLEGDAEIFLHWLLGDEVNGGFIRSVCYTVWNKCHHPEHEDGNTDWANDTLPMVQKAVTKIRERLSTILATGLVPDEAAIRADERKRLLGMVTDKLKDETSERYAKGWNNALIAVCAAIRSGGAPK